jgi:hypothetical protein
MTRRRVEDFLKKIVCFLIFVALILFSSSNNDDAI